MTRYQFDIAEARDDAALRRVMAQTAMPGSVTLTFQREPNYFDSNRVLGRDRQTIVCRDTKRNEIVGLATRSVRDQYVDGQIRPVGYLGALRSIERVRHRGLLARGYRFLKELHDADFKAPEYYLTTIAEGNQQAIDVLTSGRAGLPTYHPLGRLHTLALPIREYRNSPRCAFRDNCEVSLATDLEEVIDFLNACGLQRTFFPAYQQADFQQPDGTFHDLGLSSIVIVRLRGQIIAAAGLWDQRACRQMIVNGYPRSLHALRPLWNVWARVSGGIPLPRVGGQLMACFVGFPVVSECDDWVLPLLLRQLMRIAPSDAEFLLLGLFEDDPLLSTARRLSRSQYITRLYAVTWGTIPESIVSPEARSYYLELGSL